MPAIPLHSDKLLERFKKNLTTEISTEDAPELSSQEEEPMDIDMHGRDEDVAPEHAPDEPCKLFICLLQLEMSPVT